MHDEKRPALFEPCCVLFRLGERRALVHGPEGGLGMALENAALRRYGAIHLADLFAKR